MGKCVLLYSANDLQITRFEFPSVPDSNIIVCIGINNIFTHGCLLLIYVNKQDVYTQTCALTPAVE